VCYVCLVGSSEDGLRPRQQLSSVPGRTRLLSGGAFAPCLVAAGRDCGFGWGRSSFVRYRRGSSSPSVVASGSVLDLPHLLRLGMGRAQSEIAFFTPITVSSRWRLRRCMTDTMATGARRMVATSEDGGRPCRQSRPLRRWLLHKLIHNINSLIQSVAVHAVLGGGAPR
jgi:hypothetical protein